MRERKQIEKDGAEGRNAFALLLEVELDVRDVLLDLQHMMHQPVEPILELFARDVPLAEHERPTEAGTNENP